jgi:endoglucanase Acf2
MGKGDAVWLAANRDLIMACLRDIANPRRDAYFPLTRMLDWWGGHSWAGGIPVFNDGKNQVCQD